MLVTRTLPKWQSTRTLRTAVPACRVRSRNAHTLETQYNKTDPITTVEPSRLTTPQKPRAFSFGRVLSGIFIVGAFGIGGFALAWYQTTTTYLKDGRAMHEPGTRKRNIERFNKDLDESTLVSSLKSDSWIEEKSSNQGSLSDNISGKTSSTTHGQHLVNENLATHGHLVTRQFRHPTEPMTILVFMADRGCESWPNTLHGGIATTVIQEALDVHTRHFPGYTSIRNRKTTMNYTLPLHPESIYSVLVRTDNIVYPLQSSSGVDKSFMAAGVSVLVNAVDRAPQYVEKYNEKTKTNERVLKTHDVDKNIKAYVRGGSTILLATKSFRDRLGKDQQVMVALQEKLDTWLQDYGTTKITAVK